MRIQDYWKGRLVVSVFSMTGFAHYQVQTLLGYLAIDLKAVNSRFLEISCRLPDELKAWEGDIRAMITSNIKRGKVDCRISWMGDVVIEKELDQEKLQALLNLQTQVLEQLPEAKPLSVENILMYPGLLKAQTIDEEKFKSEIFSALHKICVTFMRICHYTLCYFLTPPSKAYSFGVEAII